MELTVKDVLKMENIMNKVKDVVSNSVTITDHKSAGSIRLTECTMREFEGFDICYLADNKEEAGNYLGSFFIENADSDKPKMVYYEDAYEEKGKKEIPLYEANENPTISYENYQLQWMMDHGYSLQDLMRSMEKILAIEKLKIYSMNGRMSMGSIMNYGLVMEKQNVWTIILLKK